jgi:hypothetical protein
VTRGSSSWSNLHSSKLNHSKLNHFIAGVLHFVTINYGLHRRPPSTGAEVTQADTTGSGVSQARARATPGHRHTAHNLEEHPPALQVVVPGRVGPLD